MIHVGPVLLLLFTTITKGNILLLAPLMRVRFNEKLWYFLHNYIRAFIARVFEQCNNYVSKCF